MNLVLLERCAAALFLLSASLYAADTIPAAPAQAKPSSATSAAAAKKTKPAASAVPVSNVKSGDPAPKPLRIAYVVRRSGAMTDLIAPVKKTLELTIPKLNQEDQFYFSSFSSGPVMEMDKQLVPATEDNKRRAMKFVAAIVAGGKTEPEDAIRKAFALKPDVIYLITTDIPFPPLPVLIDQLNVKHEVTVNIVSFIYDEGAIEWKKVAAKNHGAFIFVSEDAVEKESWPVLVPAADAKPAK